MTLAEFPDPELPEHRNAVKAKAGLRASMRELTARLGVEDPAPLADRLVLVLEGLQASGQALGAEGPARQARPLAKAILSSAERSAAAARRAS